MKTKINQEKRHPMQECPNQNPAKLKDLQQTTNKFMSMHVYKARTKFCNIQQKKQRIIGKILKSQSIKKNTDRDQGDGIGGARRGKLRK
jgi:hypothetical protein